MDPSNPDALGPEGSVVIIEMSSFQGLKAGVFVLIIADNLVQVSCVHIMVTVMVMEDYLTWAGL